MVSGGLSSPGQGSGFEEAINVVVAVLTYRRPAALAGLLHKLVEQCGSFDQAGSTSTEILVVDNDPLGSAHSVATGRVGVRYVHEGVPGIAVARARAVREAGSADVIVFIDDDEEPEPGWLAALVTTWLAQGRPAGVAGRVSPVYSGEMDRWVAAGGFFTRRSYPTGTPVQAASSANLLLNLEVLSRRGLNFDGRLGLRGGEDTLLTRTLTQVGEDLIWCNEAVVVDLIPPDRMNRRWVLRRAFSHGAVASRVDASLSERPRLTRARAAIGGVIRILGGLVSVMRGSVSRRLTVGARGWRMVYRGCGMVAGAVGKDVVEYDRAHK